jgi:D-beta-D-heptose 7-phosphate kinase / D-beta-D-heptose 1-phosphate adenosyltransferase
VDPGRIKDYAKYRDATVLTPNRAEAALVTGHEVVTVDDAKLAAREICSGFDVDTVLLKLDSEGIVLAHGGHARHCPTRRREVYDVTGAGDMVLAMVSLCRACGFEWRETAHLANLAAGTEIERLGVAPVTKDELRAQLASRLEYHRRKLCTLDELVLLRERYRNQNKNVVFTNGCFDLLHIGHVSYLQQAKELGDVLIVAINSDECVQRLKGPARPIIDEFARAALLAALDCVDHVVVFSEDTPHSLLSALRPEYLVKGGTYGLSEVVGHDIVEAYGGQVRVLDKWEGVSTTSIVTRCQTVS